MSDPTTLTPPADTIWVVWETRGEYSDRTENVLCWYATQADAEREAARLTAAQNTSDWDRATYCAAFVERGPVHS